VNGLEQQNRARRSYKGLIEECVEKIENGKKKEGGEA